MIAKVIAYIVYLVIIVAAYFVQSSGIILVAEITFIVVGVMTMIYSYGIFNISALSYLHSSHPDFAR
jgi:hypothetical protein